jgi:hypothetical protein
MPDSREYPARRCITPEFDGNTLKSISKIAGKKIKIRRKYSDGETHLPFSVMKKKNRISYL